MKKSHNSKKIEIDARTFFPGHFKENPYWDVLASYHILSGLFRALVSKFSTALVSLGFFAYSKYMVLCFPKLKCNTTSGIWNS